jgi:hypothetical protein
MGGVFRHRLTIGILTGMAKLMGQWPSLKTPGLLTRLVATVSEPARLQVEAAAGEGYRRLEPVLQALPESITLLRGPVLGFSMQADGCLLGPGRIVIFSLLHWQGAIAVDEKGAWTGAGGRVDLGRPDRRAALFANRLSHSGLAGSLDVEPIVILTGGPIRYSGPTEALLVPLDELEGYLVTAFQAGAPQAPLALINTLLGR